MPAAKVQAMAARPKFQPRYPGPTCQDLTDNDEPGWVSVLENDAYFSLEAVSLSVPQMSGTLSLIMLCLICSL